MNTKHKETINRIKEFLKDDSRFELKSKRFFEEKIKGDYKRGAWGYTPDIVFEYEEDKSFIIVEIENGVSTSKVIEDIVLSAIVNKDYPNTLLVIITIYKSYVERWHKLLKENYTLLENFNVEVINMDSWEEKDYENTIENFKNILIENKKIQF